MGVSRDPALSSFNEASPDRDVVILRVSRESIDPNVLDGQQLLCQRSRSALISPSAPF